MNKLVKFAGLLTAVLLLTGGAAVNRVEAGEKNPAQYAELSAYRHMICYTVSAGDTLDGIARQMNVPLVSLLEYNKLHSTLIRPGDILIIPGRSSGDVPAALSRGGIDREDLMLLARLIHAEARGESFTGQVAVGAVILNRLASPGFPKTIREVIFQSNGHVCQFSPVKDGSINLQPDEKAINAALQALLGLDPTGGALFFYNPQTASDRWIRTLPVITRIGNHVFADKV
ncbi:cell wall hydrolase [Desulfotomaculum copahuensis]|uniref:Cell wall hydrolase n=1 Tax=Desulfotomaculum copahuensis TaxID=1838280 RepID=A0A1B7LC17_9FIRM|nr:cell wall hydrolase [Desulfotomaculum copahuensis]OAT80262.1 cell wall hydrolase [Desulfotomaculum copahuensis]